MKWKAVWKYHSYNHLPFWLSMLYIVVILMIYCCSWPLKPPFWIYFLSIFQYALYLPGLAIALKIPLIFLDSYLTKIRSGWERNSKWSNSADKSSVQVKSDRSPVTARAKQPTDVEIAWNYRDLRRVDVESIQDIG